MRRSTRRRLRSPTWLQTFSQPTFSWSNAPITLPSSGVRQTARRCGTASTSLTKAPPMRSSAPLGSSTGEHRRRHLRRRFRIQEDESSDLGRQLRSTPRSPFVTAIWAVSAPLDARFPLICLSVSRSSRRLARRANARIHWPDGGTILDRRLGRPPDRGQQDH